ncbi:hypothetical protein ONS95_012933 [Cadophora gregata]|uniref:uncharacterized protein n=1 Tax=Cadophora gregata TaxID=51156 RepID=UPI0026DD27CC|nr:uncharacterized protein ONS95_012933 [Cadophora gregata]KAK0101083.1 hypothetical protein ONS96_006310 [Cadophora gregata f. sp. sojae]KAK0115886.1 hypothetical protein ONS95_012933 [Cadophora gregata]
MGAEQSWGGIMSTFEDCVLLLDSNTLTAASHFDDTVICPSQLKQEQGSGGKKDENEVGRARFTQSQSPSDSDWETVTGSEIDETDKLSVVIYEEEEMTESGMEYESWEDFLTVYGSEDMTNHESIKGEKMCSTACGSKSGDGNLVQSIELEDLQVEHA